MLRFDQGFEVDEDDDRYILWVNQRSGGVEKLEMTIREFGRTAVGCADFAKFRQLNGVLRPWRFSLKSSCDLENNDFGHRIGVESWVTVADIVSLTDPSLR